MIRSATGTRASSVLSKAVLLGITGLLFAIFFALAETKQQPYQRYELNSGAVLTAALAPDGSALAVVRRKGIVRLGVAPLTDYLEVWDFRRPTLLWETAVKNWRTITRREQVQALAPKGLAYTPDGRGLIYCDGMAVHIIDRVTHREMREFSVTRSSGSDDFLREAQQIAVSPNGKDLAVTETELDKSFQPISGVALNVYSLESGILKFTEKFPAALSSNGLAWSVSGDQIAITVAANDGIISGPQISRKAFADVRIINLAGRVVQVRSGYQQNWASERHLTEDVAGGVAFLADGSVVTVAGGPALGPGRKDDIRIWGADSGTLLRSITSPPNGAHYHVTVSREGRILLAYVGKDHRKEDFIDTAEQRFRLWDTSSWRVLFTSPPIPVPNITNPDKAGHFDLSSNGTVAVAWWSGARRIYVYVFAKLE